MPPLDTHSLATLSTNPPPSVKFRGRLVSCSEASARVALLREQLGLPVYTGGRNILELNCQVDFLEEVAREAGIKLTAAVVSAPSLPAGPTAKPTVPTTSAAAADVIAQLRAIKDPTARAKFYSANKRAIGRANQRLIYSK